MKKLNAFRAAQLRKAVKAECYRQIDNLLKCKTELPRLPTDPEDFVRYGTVLDDIVARSMLGYAVNVSLSLRHPDEMGRAAEDPSAIEQPPAPLILTP